MRAVARAVRFAAAFLFGSSVLLGSAGLVLAARPASAAGDESDAEPRATMQQVFDSLATLLPASLDPERFGDPARRDAIQLSFEALAQGAKDLARHGESRDAGFAALSRSLAEDAELAASRFARGRVEEAAFHVQQLTQRCVGCHSRLPSAREFPLADRLLSRVELRELAPEDRARLYVATRRFDGALGAWEAMFVDPAVPPVALEQGGQLVDYLTVAIRVAGAFERAERALRALAARGDTPRYLHTRLTRYADGLLELRAPAPPLSKLERAAGLAARAQSLADFPTAHDGLVQDLYASALLHQEVEERTKTGVGPSDAELSRAFWLLGVIEDRTVYSYWLPQTEAYMEAALRSAPRGPVARRAFERIEEILLVDYGALRLEDLPEEARTRLDALARLMEAP
jgi:hypothetical protein